MSEIDSWYLENLVCPIDHSRLRLDGEFLQSASGRRYPVVEGIPVMLVDDGHPTIGVARTTLDLAKGLALGTIVAGPPLFVETIGVTESERAAARQLHELGSSYDAVVATLIGATSGTAYRHLIGIGAPYPIPVLRFPTPRPGRLLDIGCNWGRWTIAAARAGHHAVGIDPQLGAVLAGRRVAKQLDVEARFVVADGRYLPFSPRSFDYVWSYSVLQHFSREDACTTLKQIRDVTRAGGRVRIQMAGAFGIRNLYQMARRGFRPPSDFDVRYWTPDQLRKTYSALVGDVRLDADCYLGLGLQWSDYDRMNSIGKSALIVSEFLRRGSVILPPLRWIADSLFCTADVTSVDKRAASHPNSQI